jgi:hypothetical protein
MTTDQYELPDGRRLTARILDVAPEPETEHLGPFWELELDGEVSVGHPLNSTLADLLGWNVADEDWPTWIDELAARITFGPPS